MYVVIELQKNGDAVANIVSTHATKEEAYSKYYTILAAAAISTVEVHSAIMMTDAGDPITHKAFQHTTAQEEA